MKKQSVSTTKMRKRVELVEINSEMTREQVLKNLIESLTKQGFRISDKKQNKKNDPSLEGSSSFPYDIECPYQFSIGKDSSSPLKLVPS